MSDVNTNRMRSVASILHRTAFHLMNDAADEIDRLRARVAELEQDADLRFEDERFSDD